MLAKSDLRTFTISGITALLAILLVHNFVNPLINPAQSTSNVVVMVELEFVKSQIKQNVNPKLFAFYRELLVAIYKENGFIVIDSKETIAFHAANVLEFPDNKLIVSTAITMGIDVNAIKNTYNAVSSKELEYENFKKEMDQFRIKE